MKYIMRFFQRIRCSKVRLVLVITGCLLWIQASLLKSSFYNEHLSSDNRIRTKHGDKREPLKDEKVTDTIRKPSIISNDTEKGNPEETNLQLELIKQSSQKPAQKKAITHQQVANRYLPKGANETRTKNKPGKWNSFLVSQWMNLPILKIAPKPSVGEPWPYPQKRQIRTPEIVHAFNKDIKIHLPDKKCDILTRAVERFQQQIELLDRWSKTEPPMLEQDVEVAADIVGVYIEVECEDGLYPSLEMKEAYNLTVVENSITVSATEIWGVLHALETLYQLLFTVKLPSSDHQYVIIKEQWIEDAPVYKHRGLLVDSARHYLAVQTLYRLMDSMRINKFNVFHWHIVDDESFPLKLDKFPEMAKGAYSERHVYTEDDVREVIEYGRLRGIRVIPELDVPGHTRSWGYGHPEIMADCGPSSGARTGTLHPLRNETYLFLHELYKEIDRLFPERVIHVGGDEVKTNCWYMDETISKELNKVGQFQLTTDFFNKFHKVLHKAIPNTLRIHWEEVFYSYHIPMNYDVDIFHSWLGNSNFERALSKGFRSLYSGCWYLDKRDLSWRDAYDCNPEDKVSKSIWKSYHHNLLGGEACLWSEFIDENNIMQMAWPRASATAERLWSNRKEQSYHSFVGSRFQEHVCRMKRQGIPVAPDSGVYMCGTTHFLDKTQSMPKSQNISEG